MSNLPDQETDLDNNLRSKLRLSSETGHICLDEQRMVMLHTTALGSLRQEMIETLGIERARGLLTRTGYASGRSDALFAKRLAPHASDEQLLMVGPKLHNLEGVVNVRRLRLDIDIPHGRYLGEFVWEASHEAEIHVQSFGVGHGPVCWMQIGYACGFTTQIMGKFILYRELECAGKGDRHCRILGKPRDAWNDPEEDLKYFKHVSIADQFLELQNQVEGLRNTIRDDFELKDIVGQSSAYKSVCRMIKKFAGGHVTVLLLGETGVGKEVFARRLHQLSPRARAPFVAINCAAIPEELIESELFGVEKGAFTGATKSRPGRFERAQGGTLFLDEVGELSLSAQTKLLRVLQEGEFERVGDVQTRKVDVRLVAATNKDLEQAVKDGEFRADLYYRLNICPVIIPPLRERREDISLLMERFVAKHSARHEMRVREVSDDAIEALLKYDWPGNIRELENVIERGVILATPGKPIELHHLFPPLSGHSLSKADHGTQADALAQDPLSIEQLLSEGVDLKKLEQQLLEAAVDRAKGNLSAAARMLGLTRPQLAYRLKKRI